MLLKVLLVAEVALVAAFLASSVADNWVPILAVGGSIMGATVTPIILSYQNNRAIERREDRNWKRQDAVAAQVEKAAKLAETVAEKAATVAEKVSEVADTTASSAAATETKLDEVAAHVAARATTTETKLEELATGQQQIHALVNGHLTVSMNGQLAALRNERIALITLADLQEASSKPVFQETRQQAEDVSKAVVILERAINDRLATEQGNLKG